MEKLKNVLKTSPSIYTRTAGIMLLISILAGVFGEIGVISELMVPGNPEATAIKIRESLWLYRLGFASYLLEAICDVTLALLFYQLLKPIRKDLALLSAFFGLMATATFAFAELFYFIVPVILNNNLLTSFSPEQVNELVMLCIKIYGNGAGIFMLFYGFASILRGYLIYNSWYLPRFLGIFLMIGGTCFVVRNFILVLAPAYASDLLLVPMLLTMLLLAIWFLVKGVNLERWEQKIAESKLQEY
jgi:hypothetical protein